MLRITSLKDSFLGAKVHFKRGDFSSGTSKALVFALHPHAGTKGGGEAPKPGLGLGLDKYRQEMANARPLHKQAGLGG